MNAIKSVRGFTGGAYAGVIARYNENKDHYHDALCTVGGEDPRVKAVIADEKFHILDKRANKLYIFLVSLLLKPSGVVLR